MNYITKWCDDILSRSSLTLQSSVRVEGVRDEHLGPRLEYAKIDVLAEPATSFDVQFGTDIEQNENKRLFLEAAVFGLLDVLLLCEPHPVRNVCITVTHLQYDPIDSSQMAFRHAGRDAGRKILATLRSEPYPK